MSLLDDICAYIELHTDWDSTNVFATEMGDTPDTACVVTEYAGSLDYMMGGATASIQNARFQVVVRALDYATARTRAGTLSSYLDAVGDQTLTATKYLRIMALDTPHPLPDDARSRKKIAVNFMAVKEPS